VLTIFSGHRNRLHSSHGSEACARKKIVNAMLPLFPFFGKVNPKCSVALWQEGLTGRLVARSLPQSKKKYCLLEWDLNLRSRFLAASFRGADSLIL
jgi:hypothetical protein